MALAFSAGALVFAGASALYSWYAQEKAQRDQGYYCLPPRDGDIAVETGAAVAFKSSFLAASAAADGARETAAKDAPSHSPDALSEGCGVALSGEADGGHPCVCCLERHQSFMFVQCRHICLCEPCLIQLGRAYEDNKLRAHFDGPQNYEASIEESMRASYMTFILSYYPSLDPNLPRPPRHSSHAVYRQEGESRSVTGVAAAAATPWTAAEPSLPTGLTCAIPLAFAAAHPLARLATEKSAAGYRACGVLSLRAGPGTVGPPPGLCVRRDAVFSSQVAQAQDLHGENSSRWEMSEELMLLSPLCVQSSRVPTCIPSRQGRSGNLAVDGTTCPPQRPLVLPTESSIVVLLHAYREAARELEEETKQANAEQGRRGAATTEPTSAIWQALQPLLWWLESCVRPAQSRLHRECAECRMVDGASDAARRRREAAAKQRTPLNLLKSAASVQWCPHAVVEVGLCGLSNGSPLPAFASLQNPLISRGQPLWGLAQQRRDRWLLELCSLEDVGARTAPTNSVAHAPTGCRHDANDADMQRDEDEPLSRRRGDASSPATRLLASLPVPLLPLHTLDLSLRTDLGSLEDGLSQWAAAFYYCAAFAD
ncbi:hypothetical protein CGC21_23685 [Leishmania donovani]|uniref:Integral membrane protein n=1 Tax=Leishmania donovani TaxID=5661 RepID=A0A504XKH2_LEIDO|nr:hypothetical protein CGC21_23685 [Leishmania donovani]